MPPKLLCQLLVILDACVGMKRMAVLQLVRGSDV
jgi:hypothetical protein